MRFVFFHHQSKSAPIVSLIHRVPLPVSSHQSSLAVFMDRKWTEDDQRRAEMAQVWNFQMIFPPGILQALSVVLSGHIHPKFRGAQLGPSQRAIALHSISSLATQLEMSGVGRPNLDELPDFISGRGVF